MPTVQEVLKSTGLTDEQISALDPKIVTGVTQVLSTATQTLEQAELAKRANEELYEKEISPALVNWASKEANLNAELSYYKTLAEKAKTGGFIAEAAPFTPTAPVAGRDASGKFVPGANPVPGSPGFEQKLRDDIGGAFSFAADTTWKYRQLFGTEMPDSPTAIIREAAAAHMSPSEFAAKKYDFAGREKAAAEQKQKEHDEAIRKEAVAQVTKEFTERTGSNPMIRQAEVSRFTDVAKAVKSGERKDPLTMTREQRHGVTRQAIQKEIAANETVQ
ncbi:MAG: hypothetical protein WA817_15925 [Candidatus Acidiferrum sp.]